MEPDPGNRFEHLLKPIRDLSTVWNIDVAESLETYCEEVSRLRVTNQLDKRKEVNFAEAALLIQGSTAIYSQKVEMLYKLVYQALDLIASDKAKEAQQKRRHAQTGGLWAPIPETEALLTIDHLLKDGRNVTHDENASQEPRQFVQRRLPLFLMPREKVDRRRQDFRISSCRVHSSGAYLLQESDSKLLDELLLKDDGISQFDDEPLAPPPPVDEVAELDLRLQELRGEIPNCAPPDSLADMLKHEGNAPSDAMVKNEDQPQQDASRTLYGPDGSVDPGSAAQPPADPWWCYNEHEPGPHEAKLEVGISTKRLDRSKLKRMMQRYNEAGTWDAVPDVPDESIWNSSDVTAGLVPTLDGNLIEPLFLEIASYSKSGSRFATHKLGLSSAWLEFEDLLSEAYAKEKQSKHSKKPQSGVSDPVPVPATPQGIIEEDDLASPPILADILKVDVDDETLRAEEHRQEVARIENLIQERQAQYNDTIRDKLFQMEGGGAILEQDDKRFPELWANVRRWTEQLVPVLKEHETRPEFDIDAYGTKVLSKMNTIKEKHEDAARPVPFARLVHNQPRWEICRRFLTCLQLTNQGNTNIVYGNEQERLNKFGLQLVKMERETMSLETQDSAPAPLPPPKRLRRMSR